MAYTIEILEALKNAENGLLSKIKIGNKTYELKDLIAREHIEALATMVGNVPEGSNLADIVANIQENAYDDTALQNAIKALQDALLLKADKTQVAADIKAAVDAEAALARAAEEANATEIARVDAALKLAIDDEDGNGLNSIKDLATWIEEHGEDAAEMSAAITKNAEDIAAMDEAYKKADADLDGRLDVVEAALGEGEGSVADQIADAIDAAKGYTDGEIDKVEAELAKKEDKTNLKAFAYADQGQGTVAGQTIKDVKATGTSTGSINVALKDNNVTIVSEGNYTPAGTVTGGKVTPAGTVAITVTNADAQAVLATADYQPAGSVSVTPTTEEVQVVKNKGTAASFTEGEFHAATLDHSDVTASYVDQAIVGSVDGETLTFTEVAAKALAASKVNSFSGGSKDADTFNANVPAEVETKAVMTAVAGATFTGTVAAGLKVTGVTYQKHDAATATFTGSEVDVTGATFNGSAATISVEGSGKTYAIDAENTKFNGAAIELNVGDIVVAEKTVTVAPVK